MRTVIIVQARMTSTRLPGKVLLPVLGKPLLEYQIERLKRVCLADEIVIATTLKNSDDPIVELCDRLSVKYFRGSEEDVLSRYYHAAIAYKADVVVRITSDCPLIDPEVITRVISHYKKNYPKYDYVSNSLERTYPRGMDTEVFAFKCLKESFNEATKLSHREHVTPFIYLHSERYSLDKVLYLENHSHQRWTVDTKADFELIRRIIEALYPQDPAFTLETCLQLMSQKSEWFKLNSHVEQKSFVPTITH